MTLTELIAELEESHEAHATIEAWLSVGNGRVQHAGRCLDSDGWFFSLLDPRGHSIMRQGNTPAKALKAAAEWCRSPEGLSPVVCRWHSPEDLSAATKGDD